MQTLGDVYGALITPQSFTFPAVEGGEDKNEKKTHSSSNERLRGAKEKKKKKKEKKWPVGAARKQ